MCQKLEDLQSLNQSLTNLLVDKGSPSESLKRPQSKDQEYLQTQISLYQDKVKALESEKKNSREVFETRVKALQNEMISKDQQMAELQRVVNSLNNQQNPDHSICESRLSDCISKIQSLESQLLQKSNLRPADNYNKKIQVLEEENQILKEQIEIYQEDQQKKISEKEKLQKLSYLILSKDKNVEPETINLVRKTLGDTQANIIETFYEKSQNSEKESKGLMQKLAQEYAFKLESLEKIRTLQEILAKMAPDCGYDNDISKVKAQIIATKAQVSGNNLEKVASGMDLYEKTVEIDILKGEVKGLRTENGKLKEDHTRTSEKLKEAQERLSLLEAKIDDKDILCFIQCEAAALEDMLGEPESQELDSEDFY